jgi:hypothetical protein
MMTVALLALGFWLGFNVGLVAAALIFVGTIGVKS